MSDKNIYQRINAVMREVKYVQTDVTVSGGGSYKAVSHDMVLAVLRKAMVDQGIVTRVQQISGEYVQLRDLSQDIKMSLYQGKYQIDYVNMDDCSQVCTTINEGHAADNGDKAPGKSLSYAVKFSMLKTFGLETGENDESRMPEAEDCSDALVAISNAPDMDQLQTIFKLQWAAFPKSRPELTAAKDGRKKALTQ